MKNHYFSQAIIRDLLKKYLKENFDKEFKIVKLDYRMPPDNGFYKEYTIADFNSINTFLNSDENFYIESNNELTQKIDLPNDKVFITKGKDMTDKLKELEEKWNKEIEQPFINLIRNWNNKLNDDDKKIKDNVRFNKVVNKYLINEIQKNNDIFFNFIILNLTRIYFFYRNLQVVNVFRLNGTFSHKELSKPFIKNLLVDKEVFSKIENIESMKKFLKETVELDINNFSFLLFPQKIWKSFFSPSIFYDLKNKNVIFIPELGFEFGIFVGIKNNFKLFLNEKFEFELKKRNKNESEISYFCEKEKISTDMELKSLSNFLQKIMFDYYYKEFFITEYFVIFSKQDEKNLNKTLKEKIKQHKNLWNVYIKTIDKNENNEIKVKNI